METDQDKKKLDWLDDERRKDKMMLASFEERLSALEGNVAPFAKQIGELNSELTRLNAMMGRFDQYDGTILQARIEAKSAIEDLEKQIVKREEEVEKLRRLEIRALDEDIAGIRKELVPIKDLQRGLQIQSEEDLRLGRSIDELRQGIEAVRRNDEEYVRSYRLLEDGRRQDSKRLTDLQGEVTALRKNFDDQRGRMELASSALQKIDSRLNELFKLEEERREEQTKFLDNQSLAQVERDRVWKEWKSRFETIESQTADVEKQLQTLDSTHRSVKRSQQTLEELSQLVERRLSEMTEIQRLSDERFRQEWVTFKADDQKRWTNYTLTQEEQRGELSRQYDRLIDRVTHVEDSLQEIQDVITQMHEHSEKQLQSLLALISDWVSTFDRSIGRIR